LPDNSVSSSFHKVRITNNNNGANSYGCFVDVTVWDAISLISTNGQEIILNVAAVDASPGSSRLSHFITVTDESDNTRFLTFEILDAVATVRTNGQTFLLNMGSSNASIFPVAPDEVTLQATDPITGNNLVRTEAAIVYDLGGATRKEGIAVNGEGNLVANPDGSYPPYLLSGYPVAISLEHVNGQEWFINRTSGGTLEDTTQYDEDGNPPANNDPNTYVIIPDDTSGIGTGSALISQGLLWEISRIHNPKPFYLLVWFLSNGFPSSYTPFSTITTDQKLVDQQEIQQTGGGGPSPTYTTVQVWLFKMHTSVSGTFLLMDQPDTGNPVSATLFSWSDGQNPPDLSGVDISAIATAFAAGSFLIPPFPYTTSGMNPQATIALDTGAYFMSTTESALAVEIDLSAAMGLAWSG
jgi:hypothetical protein